MRITKFITVLLLAAVLAGCSTLVPVQVKAPEPPPELQEKCAQLQKIDRPDVKLSEFVTVVVQNYTRYHQCADLVQAWQTWYKSQRDIINRANNAK